MIYRFALVMLSLIMLTACDTSTSISPTPPRTSLSGMWRGSVGSATTAMVFTVDARGIVSGSGDIAGKSITIAGTFVHPDFSATAMTSDGAALTVHASMSSGWEGTYVAGTVTGGAYPTNGVQLVLSPAK